MSHRILNSFCAPGAILLLPAAHSGRPLPFRQGLCPVQRRCRPLRSWRFWFARSLQWLFTLRGLFILLRLLVTGLSCHPVNRSWRLRSARSLQCLRSIRGLIILLPLLFTALSRRPFNRSWRLWFARSLQWLPALRGLFILLPLLVMALFRRRPVNRKWGSLCGAHMRAKVHLGLCTDTGATPD